MLIYLIASKDSHSTPFYSNSNRQCGSRRQNDTVLVWMRSRRVASRGEKIEEGYTDKVGSVKMCLHKRESFRFIGGGGLTATAQGEQTKRRWRRTVFGMSEVQRMRVNGWNGIKPVLQYFSVYPSSSSILLLLLENTEFVPSVVKGSGRKPQKVINSIKAIQTCPFYYQNEPLLHLLK